MHSRTVIVFLPLLVFLVGVSAARDQQIQDEQNRDADYRFENFISNDAFLAELELTDEQRQQILDTRFRLEERMFEVAQQQGQTNRTAREAFTREFEQAFFEILLPFQQQRARQLVIWSKINQKGFGATVTGWPVVTSRLEATEDQLGNIQKTDDELLTRYREELQQLQLKYIDALKQDLSDEQLQAFEMNFGDLSVVGTPPSRF